MESTEMEFKPAETKKPGLAGTWASTKLWLYNPQTKAIVGRDCGSWGRITLFYFVFYVVLGAFFAIMWASFFTTVPTDRPRQSHMESLIKGNPGMGFIPRPDVDKTIIRFKQGRNETYDKYTKAIDKYLERYNESSQGPNMVDCANGTSDDFDPNTQYCYFNASQELAGECSPDNDYGYYEGKPCVLLKLNKVFGWQPEPFENGTKGQEGADGENILLTCEGENGGDRDNLGKVLFYPPSGFPVKYYPFNHQQGYQSPLVFVHFTRPTSGVLIQIWCKAWAKNIMHHKNDKAGSVHIELLID